MMGDLNEWCKHDTLAAYCGDCMIELRAALEAAKSECKHGSDSACKECYMEAAKNAEPKVMLFDKVHGTPCAQISWNAEKEQLSAEIELLRQQLAACQKDAEQGKQLPKPPNAH